MIFDLKYIVKNNLIANLYQTRSDKSLINEN
jgi:hypothetical protein